MSIQEGDTIPSVTLKQFTDKGFEDISTDDVFRSQRVVLLCMPGAFSPTCSDQHLPGYLSHLEDFQAKGIDKIVCLTVNDPFVVRAWVKSKDWQDKLVILPDGNATLTRELGLDFDASGLGLGVRSKRCSILVEDMIVKKLLMEDNPAAYDKTKAEILLSAL